MREVKALQGTLRKHREKSNPDTPKLLHIDPPNNLSEPAKKIWRDVSVIIEVGAVKLEHSSFLAVFCNELSRYWQLEAKIKELEDQRPLGEDPEHDKVIRRLMLSQKEKFQNAIRVGQDYGLTPLSNQRIDIQRQNVALEDPLDI